MALSGCKPHSCPRTEYAVLYSPDNGDIIAWCVFCSIRKKTKEDNHLVKRGSD
ncbi:hypothetical protein KIF59_03850 [Enterobacter cloacae subsp. cloacae]|nr:hypothetical protein [Enterobacter cloacae subsp. cloacae]